MLNKRVKIFILVPDGVSLRNFAYSNFYNQGKEDGLDIIFWHHTPFDFETLGFDSIRLQHPKLHWLTTILKNVRKHIEISLFAKRHKDNIYFKYLFPLSYKNIKNSIRSFLTKFFVFCFNSEKGIISIRNVINELETQTTHFNNCKLVLENHKPDLVFCTSQRNALAIAPLLAAKDLGIPTMCFIFSWDNLPKATLDVSADFYFVWSEHMKNELLHYQRYLNLNQIRVSGTPQFEFHYNKSLILSKDEFYSKYNLEQNTTYLCYSGDDVTTSPKDELYLRDVAKAIRDLNSKGHKLGLIFRRCPVDFSNRYDSIIATYKDVIIPIQPEWKKIGGAWDTILPLPEDSALLVNLAKHTEVVINLGSSMVFDFAIHQKPCMYMNYNYLNKTNTLSEGVYVYDYVHFRSKPSNQVVVWLNHPDDISKAILDTLKNSKNVTQEAEKWYEKINQHPAQLASTRILDSILDVISTVKVK